MNAPERPSFRVLEHPLLRTKLARLRDPSTPSAPFRTLVREIATLMAWEVTRHLPTRAVEVDTPYERAQGHVLARPVTLVPILRAGLGFVDGFGAVLPEARYGYVGVYRNETTLEPVPYYAKFPVDVADGPVILLDPMLATGGSASHALKMLKAKGCRDLVFAVLLAAPEGVERLARDHPDVPVFAAGLDRGLDANGRIRPGLGDAGDRLFGTEGAVAQR